MDTLTKKAKQMENIVINAYNELKSREDLLLEIFNELGNLPISLNNGQNISNILGVQIRQLDERKLPCVNVDILWKEYFDNKIYVCFNVKNETEYLGLNSDEKILNKIKYFMIDDFTKNNNIIRSNCSEKVIVEIDLDAFQNKKKLCILIVDWLFVPLESFENLTLSANFLTQFQNETNKIYKPLHFTFEFSFLENDLKQTLTLQYFENVLETDAIKGLYALFLSKNFFVLEQSILNLQIVFTNLNEIKELFDIIDFGKWQLFIGKETSVWARIFIYIPADNIESFLPNNAILFTSTTDELDNFNNFINCKISSLENNDKLYFD